MTLMLPIPPRTQSTLRLLMTLPPLSTGVTVLPLSLTLPLSLLPLTPGLVKRLALPPTKHPLLVGMVPVDMANLANMDLANLVNLAKANLALALMAQAP